MVPGTVADILAYFIIKKIMFLQFFIYDFYVRTYVRRYAVEKIAWDMLGQNKTLLFLPASKPNYGTVPYGTVTFRRGTLSNWINRIIVP